VAPARPLPRIVALEGMSGIGKSRLAHALAGDGRTVLTEAYDRLRPPPSLAVPDARALLDVETRLFREEERRYRQALGLRAAGATVIADTGFLGPLTYSVGMAAIDPGRDVIAPMRAAYAGSAARGRIGVPDLTVLLTVSEATRRRRLAGDPVRHPVAWRRRHAAIGRIERSIWEGPLARRLGRRVVPVSAAGPPGAVAERVRRLLLQTSARPALTRRDAARELGECLPGAAFGKR
jgi:AAA domain